MYLYPFNVIHTYITQGSEGKVLLGIVSIPWFRCMYMYIHVMLYIAGSE